MHVVHGHERVRVAAAPDDELVAVPATVLAMHDATETGIGIVKGTGVENANVRGRGRMLLRMVVVGVGGVGGRNGLLRGARLRRSRVRSLFRRGIWVWLG